MKQITQTIFRRRFIRYVLVGAGSVALDYIVLVLFYHVLHLPLIPATVTAFALAVTVNYAMQLRWAFNATFSRQQLVAYLALLVFNMTATTIFVAYMDGLAIGPEVSKIIAAAVVTLWNFILFQRLIFKPQP